MNRQLQAVSEAREAGERMGQALATDGAVIVPARALEALRRKAALMQELAEIDENLIRNDLSELMQGLHHVRRKRVYERLFPEVKHGGDRKSEDAKKNQTDKLSAWSYAADAANATGESERTVRRKTRIGEALEPIAVWFSTRTDWEPTAMIPSPSLRVLFGDSLIQRVRYSLPIERTEPYRRVFEKDLPLSFRRRLEQRAKQVKAVPSDWRVIRAPVALADLQREVEHEGRWIKGPLSIPDEVVERLAISPDGQLLVNLA